MSTTLRVGDVVRSNQNLHQTPVRLSDWETFSPGVRRHRYTNELRAIGNIPRNELVSERTYAPGELIGIVEYEDLLADGQFFIRWYEVADTTKPIRAMLACERNFALELGNKGWTPEEVTVLRSLPTPAPEGAELEAIVALVRATENS